MALIRSVFQDELDNVSQSLVDLTAMVSASMTKATSAILSCDLKLAEEVIATDVKICMGNLAQIDTPYLTEGSSGLTYAVDRFKGWAHGGHITLARGERSRLADFASEVL